ncbi:MAG: CPBP family intramembrane metalloprotease [Treponema sp.]|jgi:membrane protease YdiL (CAAX protease family)|nr:CPBP family intramembrane metalloprotease [Treponema sp.]
MYNYFEMNLEWTPLNMQVVVPILCALVFFVAYWFAAKSESIKSSFYKKYDFDKASANHIFFTKCAGFFLMGVLPTIICLLLIDGLTLAGIGLTFYTETAFFTLVWTVGLCILVIPIASFSARKPKNLINYPQIRAKTWTRSIYYKNLIGWALYLFGYELLFRGVLFMPLIGPLGIWPAVAINVALYSATHIPKGLDETIGAIPLGAVLCLLTAASGTIWIAVIVHIAMAWTNCLTALKHHPEIHYRPNEK